MINDIGTIKAAPPPAVQTRPTTPALSDREANGTSREDKRAAQEAKPLGEVVSDLNNLVRELHRELHFSVDEESGDTVIKVVDSATDEVVRQIPSEEVVRMRKHLKEAAGLIFDDSA